MSKKSQNKNKPKNKSKGKTKPELTKNQKLYEKELKKLKRRISYAKSNKGLEFDTSTIIPEKPKRITKADIQKLHDIRGEKLWQYGKPIEREPEENNYDDWENDYDYDDAVLRGIEDRIAMFEEHSWQNEFQYHWHKVNKDRLEGLLDMVIYDEGRYTVAERLNSYRNASYINELVDKVLYDSNSSEVENSLHEFAQIIANGALEQQQGDIYGW